MRKSWLLLFGMALFGGFVMGTRFGRHQIQHGEQKPGRRILCYRDPMHPWYTSDHPGKAPDCGMPLEPVYTDSIAPPSPTSGSVTLSPVQQQLIGVVSTTVREEAREVSFQTLGRVTAEENRVYSVSAGADGWVREVYKPSTGAFVEKDAPLARLFSRDLLTPEQAYLYALESADPHRSIRSQEPQQEQIAQFQLKQATDQLGDAGLSAAQVAALKKTRKLTNEFVLHSPVSGFVLYRNASPGQRFGKGNELYRVADLHQVWILADISSEQAGFVHPGQRAVILLDGKVTGLARVTEILPQFDATARTLRIRLEAENPGFALRPDMFVNVTFRFSIPPSISVPSDAVIDTGLHKIVYLLNDSGSFMQRVVHTGWRFNDRVQITDGLKAGDRIVTSGNFLIDSETRMKAGGDD